MIVIENSDNIMDSIKNFVHKHHFTAAIVSTVFLFVFCAGGLVLANGETLEPNDSHVVSLYLDGRDLTIPTRSETVGEFLNSAKIELGEGDIVEPDKTQKIESDMFRIRIARARPYTVSDGVTIKAALTAHTSPKLIAEAAGISLRPADTVGFAPLDTVGEVQVSRTVTVKRAKQVTLTIYGVPQIVYTNVSTIAELFKEVGLQTAADDEFVPSVETAVTDNMTVFVNRNGIQVATEEIIIDPPIEYVTDNDLTLGTSVTRDPGAPGKKIVTYEITMQNGREVSRKEINSIVVEQPRTKIVARGRAQGQIGAEKQELMALAGINTDEYAAADYIIGKESGWCATKWQGNWGYCPEFYAEKFPGAENDRSLGYGLCQSTPAAKMASVADDWRTNAVTQLKWCTNYARGRYGDWNKAYDFWVANRWW